MGRAVFGLPGFNFFFVELDINRAWEVNPYDASAYGTIVVLLLALVIYLGKKLTEKEAQINTLYDKIHSITDVMSEKLSEIKTLTEISTEKNIGLKEKIIYILDDIKTRLNRLESGDR